MRNKFLSGLLAAACAAVAMPSLQAQPLRSPQPAIAAPTYTVVPCCEMCPTAANPAAYNNGFLENFKVVIQGQDGWLFRTVQDLQVTFGPDEEGYRELRQFRDALKRHGVTLVIAYLPTRGLMHADELPPAARANYNLQLARVSYTMTLKRFRDAGIVVPALEKLLYEHEAQRYFSKMSHHWASYGARRTAELTAETIRKLPSFAGIPQKKFVTKRIGFIHERGTMQRAVKQLCGFLAADEYMDWYETEAESSGDLLGNEDIPEVALVGDSFSHEKDFNFAGFLSQYLGVDIVNEAVEGGGYDSALLQYLPSDDFQKHPPKILIWEVPSYHSLDDPRFYRQVIPRVTNGCKGKPALLSRFVELHAGRNEVLFNGGGKVLPLVGKDYQLDLQFSDPVVSEMHGVVWYTNGGKEELNLNYSKRLNAGGRFITEFRNDGDWGDRTFLSLDLNMPEPVKPGLSVTAQVCARDGAMVSAAVSPPIPK